LANLINGPAIIVAESFASIEFDGGIAQRRYEFSPSFKAGIADGLDLRRISDDDA
jgi:hypothetical protein